MHENSNRLAPQRDDQETIQKANGGADVTPAGATTRPISARTLVHEISGGVKRWIATGVPARSTNSLIEKQAIEGE